MSLRSRAARNQHPGLTLDPYIPEDNDTVILVLGQIGAGKSTFINSAIGLNRDFASVGHDMGGSHTTNIQPFSIPALSTSHRRVVLVDTPGFNETSVNDRRTLQRIIQWLHTSCNPTTIAGIIYVYEITQSRLLPEKDYMHPSKFISSPAAQHIVLATVKWNELPKKKFGLGERREHEMKTRWKDMFDNGSRVIRFLDTPDSARSIVSLLCSRCTTAAVVQRELTKIFGVLPSHTKPAEATKSRGGFFLKLFGGK